MVEKVFISPNRVRAYGNIMNMKTGDDFTLVNSELTVTTDTVDGAEMTVFSMGVEPHISVSATNPYLVSGETTDLVVSLVNVFGSPLSGKTVTVTGSDGSVYNGITNSQGIYTLYNVEVSSDTTFTATYGTVTASCTVEYCIFVDYGITSNNQSDGYYVGRGTYNLTDTGLEIITAVVSGSNQYNFRIYNGAITVPFEISFELVSNNTDNARMYFYNGNYGTELGSLSIYDLENPTLVKFTVTSEKITRTIGTTSMDMTLSTTIGSTVSTRFGYNQSASAETTKIRNYRVKAL